MKTRGTIQGWVGAALERNEIENLNDRRREALIYLLGSRLYLATSPDVPPNERAAMLLDAEAFADAVHKQILADALALQAHHEHELGAAMVEGATACAPYQRRVIDANIKLLLNPETDAEERARFLDRLAPVLDKSEGGSK